MDRKNYIRQEDRRSEEPRRKPRYPVHEADNIMEILYWAFGIGRAFSWDCCIGRAVIWAF